MLDLLNLTLDIIKAVDYDIGKECECSVKEYEEENSIVEAVYYLLSEALEQQEK